MAAEEFFRNKRAALFHMAQHFASNAEAAGFTDWVEGMGVQTSVMTEAEEERAGWAMDEVIRRLRNMGNPEEG